MTLYKGTQLIAGSIPNSANKSLTNLDSTGQDKFDAKVNKSGDTMTGDLIITKSSANDDSFIEIKNTDISGIALPSSNCFSSIDFRANDDSILGRVLLRDTTTAREMALRVINTNATDNDAFTVGVKSDNTFYCTFPNTTCVDGQWTNFYQEAVGGTAYSLAKNTNHSWTFSNLPAQNCEVLVSFHSSAAVDVSIYSSLFTSQLFRAAGAANQNAAIILPVGTDKKIWLYNLSPSVDTNITFFRIFAYRKIGSNAQWS